MIKGLSEIRRIPRLGKIHLGEKKKSEKATIYIRQQQVISLYTKIIILQKKWQKNFIMCMEIILKN